MGDIIRFPNKDKNEKNKDMFILKSMMKSTITAKIHILPEELHAILRVLLKEKKEIKNLYNEALTRRDKVEAEYWKNIQEAISSLISKIKEVSKVDDYLQDLSMIELDCLVGSIEQSLQETYLLELQLIKDEIPLVTQLLKQSYNKVISVYQEKRTLFEKENKDKN